MAIRTSYPSYYNNIPCISRNRRAFSKKDGPPSISSNASKMGLPTTKDFTGRFSLPEQNIQETVILPGKLIYYIDDLIILVTETGSKIIRT